MTLLIAGTVRVPPENLEALRPHILAVVAATRAEDGCETYAFSEDFAEPGLIRIFEAWRDQAALSAHAKAPHLAAWRETGAALGVTDRSLILHEIASSRPL